VYYYPEAAGQICPILMKESLTGTDILLVFAAGSVLMAVGILILRRNRRKLEERLCE
jgi:LPXTG-motif cell wall-anchored protein